jgi:hypothetical protein
MLWLKRNLVLAISGVAALALLIVGGLYTYSGLKANAKLETDIGEAQQRLEELSRKVPFPSKTNITLGDAELKRVEAALRQTQQRFAPIEFANVSGLQFKTLLEQTVFELNNKAQAARTKLPPETEKGKGYDFTFHEQRVKANLSSAGFPMTPELLAQVAAICDVLFKAQVTEIMNIRRVRPTADDPPGQPDYTEQSVITNSVLGVVIFPYEIHLKIDPKDVGQLLEGFYKSPHGFVLRYFSTQMPGSVSTEIRQSTPAVAPKPKPFGKPGGAAATEGAVSPRVLGRQNVQLGIFLDVVKPLPGSGNR